MEGMRKKRGKREEGLKEMESAAILCAVALNVVGSDIWQFRDYIELRGLGIEDVRRR